MSKLALEQQIRKAIQSAPLPLSEASKNTINTLLKKQHNAK